MAASDRRRRRPRRALPFTRQMLLLQVAVLVAVTALGFALVAWGQGASLEQRFQEQALDVARSVAAQPGLADEVAAGNSDAVQRRARAGERGSGGAVLGGGAA